MKKLIFTLTLLSGTICGVNAQQITKNMGSSNSTFLLGNTGYARKSQLLFSPAVLANEQSGYIKRIYFKYGSTGIEQNQTLTSFKVKFGLTNENSFTGSAFFGDLTTVLDSATYTIPAGTPGTWFSIPVDTNFYYEETKTLILQVSFQTSTVQNWGTQGSSNTPVRKIIAVDTSALIGNGTSTTWQDFGFDISTQISASQPQFTTGNGLVVFPNPASDKIQIKLQDENLISKEFIILNMKGQIEMTGKLDASESNLDISGLAAGTYFFEIKEGERAFRSLFLKSK